MTPQDVNLIASLLSLVEKIGAWPFLTVMIFWSVGPWFLVVFLNRQQEKRHSEVVEMYKDNSTLVLRYEEMAARAQRREAELTDLARLNTQVQSELLTFLKTRTRCRDLKGADC